MEPFVLSWDAVHHAVQLVDVVHAMLQKYTEGSQPQLKAAFVKLQDAVQISRIARSADELVEADASQERDGETT